MAENLANVNGYMAVIKESTAGTPLTPTVFIPLYKETLNTDLHLDMDNPIVGVRSKPYNSFMGMRTHEGTITVLAEPNTAEYLFDMLLTAGSITGAGPYTHPFTEGDSNSYTIDLRRGQTVARYWGVKAESIAPSFNKDKMEFEINVAARGSFLVRKIATVATTTITLDTSYDPVAPNKGLVAADLVRLMSASNNATTLDTTVSSVNADGITVVLGASAASFSAGDYIFLRAQTPTFTTLTPFLWGRTQFCFASTASAALSATQVNIEEGSKWKLTNAFETKGGTPRSGSLDPANIVRTQTEAEVTIKKFFDVPDDLLRFLNVSGYALVIRHFSQSGYELRVTFNNMIQKTSKPELDMGKIIFNEIAYTPNYSTADGQMFDVKVLNNLAS